MPMLRTAMLMLGVLAVLVLGGLGAPSMAAETSAPPCHEAPADNTPDHDPAKGAQVMGCCIVCVTAPTPAPVGETLVLHDTLPSPLAVATPTGRNLSPEPGPPRI